MVYNSPVNEQDVDQSKQNNLAKRMWSDMTCLKKDLAECMCFFEKHVCSAYCLRKRKRTEAGEDKESNKGGYVGMGLGLRKRLEKAILKVTKKEITQKLYMT